MDKRADLINKAGIHKVFEFYGIEQGAEDNVEVLTKVNYKTAEDVDIICDYLSLNDIKHNRSDFIIK